LSDETPSLAAKFFESFAQEMRDLGWIEGQSITFERRYAEGESKSLPSTAADLVAVHPAVIVAIGTPAALAAKTATETIPIVFARIADPIDSGLVAALGRPGGNLTGVSSQSRELAAKRLELLITAVPGTTRVGVLLDPNFPPDLTQLREIEVAAPILNLQLLPVEVRGSDDFQLSVRTMAGQHADGVIVLPGEIFDANAQRIADLMAKARLPTMFQRRELVEAGGLMSYGTNYSDMYRRTAAYVDKILKGAKPADLPVQQPTKFELVINLKTAKTLARTIPTHYSVLPTRSSSDEPPRTHPRVGRCHDRAACTGCAADEDAGRRLPQRRVGRLLHALCSRFPPGTERSRLRRRTELSDRIPLGGRPL
jgi:putative ABC transport system substrate-binding protein